MSASKNPLRHDCGGDFGNGIVGSPLSEREILVVGGGTVGLGAAVMLASHGLAVHVIERRPGPSIHPRATGVGPRTLEILRQLGLADRVRAGGHALDASSGSVRAETLTAAGLRHRPIATTAMIESSTPFSPEGSLACAQDRLDAVLLEAARARGARVTNGCTLRELRVCGEDDRGVTALVEDMRTGATQKIEADIVVAADGASSGIRRQLGIGVSGPGTIGSRMMNVLFRADLRALVGHRAASMVQITHRDAPGMLASTGVVDRWTFHLDVDALAESARGRFGIGRVHASGDEVTRTGAVADGVAALAPDLLGGLRPETARALIRIAIGQPDLPVEILSMLPWVPACQLAETFRHGSVYFMGDAAHVVPPLGGFGLNTGIADPHNLAWKLALVGRGIAGPALLRTYDHERRAAARFTMDHALARIRNPELHFDHLQLQSTTFRAVRERLGVAHALVVHLGYRYASDAIVSPRADLPSLEDLGRTLDGAPGSRLPHAWIRHHQKAPSARPISTLDLVRGRFTLLAGPRASRTCANARAAAARCGTTLDIHQDLDVPWLRTAGLDDDGALLVRPDDFIAWRQPCESVVTSGLDDVLDTVLCRTVSR